MEISLSQLTTQVSWVGGGLAAVVWRGGGGLVGGSAGGGGAFDIIWLLCGGPEKLKS